MPETAAAAGTAPDIDARIAGRVREPRTKLGLSLDALAARCGVSRSMISLIERRESSATAVVLERIAAGLGVSLAALLDDPGADTASRLPPRGRTPWRDPGSGCVRRNISPPNFPSPIHVVDVVLPGGAGAVHETGARGAAIHQQIWVLQGGVEVTLGRVTHRLSEDDCLAMRLDQPGAFPNRTRKPARRVVVVATERPRVAGR